MEFQLKHTFPATEKTGTVIVAASGSELSPAARALDEASGGHLARALKTAGFEGKPGQTQTLYTLPGIAAEQVLVVGTGERRDLDSRSLVRAAHAATRALAKGPRKAVSFLAELEVPGLSQEDRISDIVRASVEGSYRFEDFKSRKTGDKGLNQLTLAVAEKAAIPGLKKSLAWGQAVATGVNRARDLGNLPPNICHPVYVAEQAKALGKLHDKALDVKVLGEKDMKKLGMGAFLAVSQGSEQEGQLVVIEYKGGKKSAAPVVLVGKGVTFDTGGISLKPGAGMDEMKFDMCGAAAVLGVMTALAESGLPINVVGVLACAENMPSGRATRPGDIVTTMSGQTVEILNTDAEGRLVLCDALTYIGRYKPAVVIDIATLTGACVVALGKVVSGLFTPNDELAAALIDAGQRSGDRTWRMPVLPDYQELLDSPFADMANISSGGPNGGAITAACFLQRFTRDYNWAHLDIAGVAWLSGAQKGGTGRPVPLLMQYLKSRAQA
ncbi:MAG: leucyl aminopeptidase [Moraxellaceae bacterium]|jgi:leucyl aminopeptidase|nr:leucyl aminopeptidase [Moraxellaceae bacterium]